jgi:CheY-like chemotaxis protein
VVAESEVLGSLTNLNSNNNFNINGFNSIHQSFNHQGLSNHTDASEESCSIKPKNKSILVIDDDESTQDILCLYFEEAGYNVETAKSAEEAIKKLNEFRPDLITLDIKMPGMDGFAYLTKHKDSARLRGIPVLVVTGRDNPEGAIAFGAQAALAKPIRRHELMEIVHKLIGEREGVRPFVMVVDDDPIAVKIISSYFDSELFEVVAYFDGSAALESIRVRKPDLLLLDLMMPEVSGFDVLSELRAQPETVGLPVVILSAKELSPFERNYLENKVE